MHVTRCRWFLCGLLAVIMSAAPATVKSEKSDRQTTGKTRYQPVEDGYQITGGKELFNRALYGSHRRDDLRERYFTFAGDRPLVMGALTDWKKSHACLEAKCGVLMVGVVGEVDVRSSRWFHQCDKTVSVFRNGWMEYDIRPLCEGAGSGKATIEVLPLAPEAGFLCRFHIETKKQSRLVLGFGGLTDFLGRFEFPGTTVRNFTPGDCKGSKITLGNNRALVEGPEKGAIKSKMWVGTSFPARVSPADPADTAKGPAVFLQGKDYSGGAPMVRMSHKIGPGHALDGFIVVIRNEEEAVLDRWLAESDPVAKLKRAVRNKHEIIEVDTPDEMLNLTVPPTVVAMDGCWHKNTFYHGTYGWHAPYLGWRNWYGPTVIGWHQRVATAMRTHAASQVLPKGTDQPKETVGFSGSQYSSLKKSHGFIPHILGSSGIFYNMQEVYVDHFLHHLEWTGNLKLAEEMFPVISRVLDWEERILDPERDGLYQNWLNTWISDAHSYNGGNCTQSSAYNFRANRTMAKIARLIGRDPVPFERRAERTRKACHDVLWLPKKGVMAEYIDTIGNKLIHPSPELATAYHSIEAGLVDPFQAYQMLRFTETDLRNPRTSNRHGRLVWSSNWYPRIYSSCGLYTAENSHLAWAYFVRGMAGKGFDILNGLVDAHFLGNSPGMTAHNMKEGGVTHGAQDFSDTLSMYLRLVVEGLFGVRFNLLDGRIEIAPNFPSDWEHARLKIKDLSLQYNRKGQRDTLSVTCDVPAKRTIRLPMRTSAVEEVQLNGKKCDFGIQPGIGRCDVVIETERTGTFTVAVNHSGKAIPTVQFPVEPVVGQRIAIRLSSGRILEVKDPSACLDSMKVDRQSIAATAKDACGWHTVFLRAKSDQWDGWLAADFRIVQKRPPKKHAPSKGKSTPLDISKHFNVSLTDIHKLKYLSPRPSGYSIMAQLNGRFGWDWNQSGYNKVRVDDSRLRNRGGTYKMPSGVSFLTPKEGKNVACVSLWDNFPDQLRFPLSGKGAELAVLLIGVTNPMQSRVENGLLMVRYENGSEQTIALVNPVNFDDWLVAPTQTENETVRFSDFNHAIVQRIPLDPSKELKSLIVRARANEVIIGVLGLAVIAGDEATK